MPRITALIANYNGAPFLARALQSVRAQRLPPDGYEIVVVDDGSTDESWRLVEPEAPHLRLLRLSHRGLPAACNAGIQQARGDYLIRLDADDEFEPDLLAEGAAVLDRAPGVALVTTDRSTVEEATGQVGLVRVDPANVYEYIAPGVMFRTRALIDVGLYDQLYWEEYDLFIRLLKRYRAHHIAAPLYRYYRHERSMTAPAIDRWNGWQALIRKWGMEELRRFGSCEELEAVAIDLHGSAR